MSRHVLTEEEAAFVDAARVAHLATASGQSEPHVVPICFARHGRRIYTPLDEKPKRVEARRLRRVRNILSTGRAALVVDRYDDDWSRLGYVQLRGSAEVIDPSMPEHSGALLLLRARYPQYLTMNLESAPIIALTAHSVVSWGNLEVNGSGNQRVTTSSGSP